MIEKLRIRDRRPLSIISSGFEGHTDAVVPGVTKSYNYSTVGGYSGSGIRIRMTSGEFAALEEIEKEMKSAISRRWRWRGRASIEVRFEYDDRGFGVFGYRTHNMEVPSDLVSSLIKMGDKIRLTIEQMPLRREGQV